MLLSVVICTRNRQAKLKQTLQAILDMEVPPGVDYELVVVNNGSTDGTEQLCNEMSTRFAGRMRVIDEPRAGSGQARRTGAYAARGEIVAAIDDDILPDRSWLKVIHQEFTSDPVLQGISGRVELLNPQDLPVGVRRSTERVQFQHLSDAYNLFAGGNMAVRSGLAREVGLFDPDFGAGTRFFSAEDAEFWYRCWRSGAKLIYVPELLVYHDHGRRLAEDSEKLARGYVIGRGAFFAKYFFHDLDVVKQIYWETRGALRAIFRKKSQWGWKHLLWLYQGFFSYWPYRIAKNIKHESSRP